MKTKKTLKKKNGKKSTAKPTLVDESTDMAMEMINNAVRNVFGTNGADRLADELERLKIEKIKEIAAR